MGNKQSSTRKTVTLPKSRAEGFQSSMKNGTSQARRDYKSIKKNEGSSRPQTKTRNGNNSKYRM